VFCATKEVKELFFQKYKLLISKTGYERRANSFDHKSNWSQTKIGKNFFIVRFGKMIANNAYQEGARTTKDMRAGDVQKLFYGIICS
jgi:hypothetical protein